MTVSAMLPEDLMAAMGGAAPQPAAGGMGGDPAAGGLPPDLMALLGGGDMGAPPAEEPAPPGGVTDGAPGGGEEALTQAIDLLQVAIDAEADQEDIQVLLQCQTKLQSLLAKNQAEADKALGGQATPRAMRRMAPGGGV